MRKSRASGFVSWELDTNATNALPVSATVDGFPLSRRTFLWCFAGGVTGLLTGCGNGSGSSDPGPSACATGKVCVSEIRTGEDVIAYVERVRGVFDHAYYKAVIGAANEYKEGDEALGISADSQSSRVNARALLANTTIGALADRPMAEDDVYTLILEATDLAVLGRIRDWTMSDLKEFLLEKSENEIKGIMVGLPSDVIGMVVRLMTNDQLTRVGRTVFNPLPGSNLGARGYMGARIQPNSPTDNTDDIIWQVFNGWAFAVGDVVLGNNPVSSEIESVHAIEAALADVNDAFGLADTLPHCCLSHIDVQAQVEERFPGSTALWFQSLGSTDAANATFDVTVEKMLAHAARRTGKYGLYFETGQGADATNGHGDGFDMVIHESRKYGFARALMRKVAEAQLAGGHPEAPWVHLNDVAGFIGPEIFRTKEQLVRCCLEDIVMGKLHGLPIGLDICSTLHMSVSLDDLDWCIDRILPANPAYLMGLPTKNDPMLSYLTTAFQDHVRIRERFGYKVDEKMWAFFQTLGIIDAQGRPTQWFGNVRYVFAKYRKAKGDSRSVEEIIADPATDRTVQEIKGRGVFLAEGYGETVADLNPELDQYIRFLYEDGKKSIFAELPDNFASTLASPVVLSTQSADRNDYILHPPSGERLRADSVAALEALRDSHAGRYDVQILVSDGLNAYAITDDGHLAPFLDRLRTGLVAAGYRVAPEHLVCTSGRVRAGYHAGEILFGSLADSQSRRAILHVIGERPGSEHHSFSCYFTAPPIETWRQPGVVDHNLTKVVANIADTALDPRLAAEQTVSILMGMFPPT